MSSLLDDLERSETEQRQLLRPRFAGHERFAVRRLGVLLVCCAVVPVVALALTEAKPSAAGSTSPCRGPACGSAPDGLQLHQLAESQPGVERCDRTGGYGPCTCGPYVCNASEKCSGSACVEVPATKCADEGHLCPCSTAVRFGDSSAWSNWHLVPSDGFVPCSRAADGGPFRNVGSRAGSRACYCARWSTEQYDGVRKALSESAHVNSTALNDTTCVHDLDMVISQKLGLSEAECLAACRDTPLCAHVTYAEERVGRTCWLMHSGCTIVKQPNVTLHTMPLVGPEAGASPGAVVFYHLYQPDPVKTRDIVCEQITAALSAGPLVSEVRYITIAGPESSNYACSKCRKVAHYEAGFEEVTLQYLYDHCVQGGSEYVIYMHNKGSYHPSDLNTQFRRFLMRGVFSDGCATLQPGENKTARCDVCSSRFSPYPHPHMPGNMWMARCDYVASLRPPSSFADEMDEFVKTAPQRPPFVFDNGHRLGTGRYANEAWIASHPSVVPCDVYAGEYMWGYFNLPTEWSPSLHIGPRFNASVYFHRLQANYLLGRLSMEKMWQWRILEWTALYNISNPAASSWAWQFSGQGA